MKTRTFLAAVALSFVAASCAKEVAEAPVKLSEMTFTAGIDTRTVLTAGYGVEWVANNSISVFDGTGNQQFTTSDSGASASFTGSADASAPEYYGLYPYNSSASCSAGVISTSLPATQTAVRGSFADGLNVSVAHTTDHSFHFLNACSLVAVDLQKYSDIVSIQLAGGADEDLVGDLSISFDGEGKPVTVICGNASKTVTLAPTSGVLEEGVYYFVVAPATYASGFNITLTDSKSQTAVITQDASVALSRAKIKAYTVRNPYWFYRCIWGNNLGLTPAKNYPNQFHAAAAIDVNTLGNLESTFIDENGNTVEKVEASASMWKKNNNIGKIVGGTNYTFSSVTSISKVDNVGIMVIAVVNGKNHVGETTVREPIFMSYLNANCPIQFSQFAFMVNPRTGGTFNPGATLTGYDSSEFLLDFRRTFNFYNINGPDSHIDGQPSVANSFNQKVWTAYFDAVGKAVNTGSKDPASYYANAEDLSNALCYINAGDYNLVVNPGKWYCDGAYANGAFSGQATYVTNGDVSGINDGTSIFPFWLWFDERF